MRTNHDFSVCTYNMLAKSLGTSTIPWVLNASPNIQKRIEDNTPFPSFKEWVDNVLKPEYMQHFHKNFDSGNYSVMRSFWGAPKCESAGDIPKELDGLTFLEEDTVAYQQQQQQQQQPKGTTVHAMTMRGIARKNLPTDLFQDFFSEISTKEESIYSWQVRGPRIFETIMGITGNKQTPPDIISIQEYDCHDIIANYRSGSSQESFSQAMASVGYSGAFFKDPLLGRDPPSGLAVFWQDDTFETVSGVTGMETLECNTVGFAGSAYNVDLEERWHSLKNEFSSSPSSTLLKAADRRNGAMCRIRHKKSGKIISLCSTHLMTTSRDCSKTNRFPGEVRAGELAALQRLVKEHAESDDAVILLGDFNTDAQSAKEIFSGLIPSTNPNTKEVCEFDTGFDVTKETFVWGSHKLADSFSKVHKWGEGVGEKKQCTSKNANRTEWIDYIFYDKERLETLFLSNCQSPLNIIPDEIHGSDHLPLLARFQFIDRKED